MNFRNGLKRMRQYLCRSHYWTGSPAETIKQSLGFGLTTFAILWLFRPYGFYAFQQGQLARVALEIAVLVSSLVGANIYLLPRLFPRLEPEDRWTVGKELLFTFGVTFQIGMAVAALLWAEGVLVHSAAAVLHVLWNTFCIAALPIFVFTAHDQNKLLQRHLARAEVYTRQWKAKAEERRVPPGSGLAVLPDEQGKVVLQLPVNRILYLQAAGNYAEVYYVDESGQAKRELLRNRLSTLQELLPAEAFLHCHRSYLANRERVREVKGNARNYELILEGAETAVPVSRSKAAGVMQALSG